MPPCVWYGMTCLLIKNTIGCVSCLVEWEMASYFVAYLSSYFVNHLNHMVQEGMFVRETLALQVGAVCSGNHSKVYTPVVDLYNGM
jgi:hypothetical protein